MKCPHCNDLKQGEFPGIGVRCKACKKQFYAGRNGVGYVSPPWYPWLIAVVAVLAGGGVVWGVVRFAAANDYAQVAKILWPVVVALGIGVAVRRYSTLPEV